MIPMRVQVRIVLITGLLTAALAACAPWPERPSAQAAYTSPETARAQEILQLASRELGAPYVYGGDTPRGFDCSGLVYYVFRHAGIGVPRTA
ncbi:MAG: C40 family peptidase, partial [Gammaproteobacteria bacterium]|nr:C40 family peptidase [Gammaproteobacteria bacterium]